MKPGPFTLVDSKGIPGEHAPNGPIVDVTGANFSATEDIQPNLEATFKKHEKQFERQRKRAKYAGNRGGFA
ncbi:MAG: hypothetical protein NVS9B14_10170 [Candidatus Acidiferrum sp.]